MGGVFATNFAAIDWWIVGVYLAASVAVGLVANRYVHNVSGYMVGGRGSGAALNAATFIGTGLGLVTIMYASMDGFSKGFSFMVLGLIGVAVGVTLGSTGFVVRRLREHRLTTIPEYFQVRYARRVRVTAGIICAVAGILNMGLFPKMGATFITHATGLGQAGDARPDDELFLLRTGDITDWEGLGTRLTDAANTPGPDRRLRELLPAEAIAALSAQSGNDGALPESQQALVIDGLNTVLRRADFYTEEDFKLAKKPGMARDMLYEEAEDPATGEKVLKSKRESLSPLQVQRLNRMLLEAAFAKEIRSYGARQDFTINVITSILIALVLLYTVLGGMVSVIVTDYVQFIILGLGLGLGLYFCLSHPDLGWSGMVGALAKHRGEAAFNPVHAGSYGWVWVIWMAIHFGAAALCWAPEATRALTAKDPATTKRTFLIGSPGQFVRLALPALLAIAAFCYVSQNELLTAHFFPAGLGKGADHAGQAMPLLLGKIVPSGLLGLLVAGLMAAFMSTHDSYFLCWSSILTRDVIAPLRGAPMSDKQQIRITRIAIVLIGLFLLVWGVWYPLPSSVWNYMAVTGSVWLCGSAVILIGGMYWRRASSAGALAALLGGLVSVVVLFLPQAIRSNTMLMGVVGLGNYAFCLIVFVVFSLLYPDPTPPGKEA